MWIYSGAALTLASPADRPIRAQRVKPKQRDKFLSMFGAAFKMVPPPCQRDSHAVMKHSIRSNMARLLDSENIFNSRQQGFCKGFLYKS